MPINTLLEELNRQKGSDLLLTANNPSYIRINNLLVKNGDKNFSADEVEALIVSMINREELETFKREKELDTAFEDNLSRYRVNLHYQQGSIAATIRRVPREIPALDSLGFPSLVKDLTTLSRGLILVTGPTGSGKSTTQAAMIDQINATRPCHIITVEDPIEFVHTRKMSVIEQREVGADTKSFPEALKRVLRQIPDVILIGEMRDLESVQMALTAAETGHLVISTLHTQDAVQTVDRVIDVFPPHQQPQVRTQLSLTLQGIIAQQLIPKKNKNGLALAYEILIANSAVRNIIRKGQTQDIYSMIEIGKQYGMVAMDATLLQLVSKGEISQETAYSHAINKEKFEKLVVKS